MTWQWTNGVKGKVGVQCCLSVSIRSHWVSDMTLSSFPVPISCLKYFHSLKIKIKALYFSTPPQSAYGNQCDNNIKVLYRLQSAIQKEKRKTIGNVVFSIKKIILSMRRTLN